MSDFIDESFLEDLEAELQKDQESTKGVEKKSLKDFMKVLGEASPTRLPISASNQSIQALANKRRKMSESVDA